MSEGNGMSAVEWREFVLNELRAIRAEAKADREAQALWVQTQFTPVRDYVVRQQGSFGALDALRRWGAWVVAAIGVVLGALGQLRT